LQAKESALIGGFFIEDIQKVPLEPWKRTGGLAARICLEGRGETNDAYICEIPPGKSLKPQKHFFEELAYIAPLTTWIHSDTAGAEVTDDIPGDVKPRARSSRLGRQHLGLFVIDIALVEASVEKGRITKQPGWERHQRLFGTEP